MPGVQYGSIQTDLPSLPSTVFDGRSLKYRVATTIANGAKRIAIKTLGGAWSILTQTLASLGDGLVTFDAGE